MVEEAYFEAEVVQEPLPEPESEPEPELDEEATSDIEPVAEEEFEPIEEPGNFEDRVQSEVVDLGQTIAYTPEMIRQAIREEMAQQRAADQELIDNPRASLNRIAAMDILEAGEDDVTQVRAREQLASLPSLDDGEEVSSVPENDNPSRSGLFRMLRSEVPSLSGPMAPVPEQPEAAKAPLESAAIPRIVLGGEKPELIDEEIELPVVDEFEQEPSFEPDYQGPDRDWEGGAFSRLRLGHVDTRSGEGETADMPEELAENAEDQQLNEEIEQIYHFRNPDFNTEVWFVAIGSDDEYHDGAKAFLAEHKAELRGAMVVEVESLGLGELCVATEEGSFRRLQASSRIKRFTRGATEATGLVPGSVKTVTNSITTVLQSGGLQAMHLMGVEDGRPALKGSPDDIMENVDEMLLEENIDFIVELMKQE